MKELDATLSADEKSKINAAKDALNQALQTGTADDIKAKTEALTQEFHTISQKLYEQAQAAQAAQAGAGAQGAAAGAGQAGPNADNVVDADYEVVDDNK